MSFIPRFYQTDAVDSVHPLTPGCRKLIVVPTGGGKSYILAKIAIDNSPILGRVLVLVNVKELVEQNAAAIYREDQLADMGIVCAGIDPRELSPELVEFLGSLDAEITVASIQSVYKKLEHWDDVGLILIDECHRITPVGGKLYRAVMDRFTNVPIIGLTATPFRVGHGYLHKGEHKLFDEIAYEITMDELIELGFLAPFATRGSDLAYSDEGLRKVAGEFSQKDLDRLTEDGAKTRRIVKQFVQRAKGRKHWLVFAINVRHARLIRQFLEEEGVSAGVVYDGMEKEGRKREDEIDLYRLGVYTALINVGVLTTGFDHPPTDCIILCRPIGSPVLFIQCIGRGSRTSRETGKVDNLVLDYGGNISRHGEFSRPDIKPPKPGKKTKACEACGEMNSQAARHCEACFNKFPDMFKDCPKCSVELDRSAQECTKCGYTYPINEMNLDEDGKTIIQNEAVWVSIDNWTLKVHQPFDKDRPECVLVNYKGVDGVTFKEYIFPESFGARPKFERFWRDHSGNANGFPGTSKEAVARKRELKIPKRVKVIRQNQYYNVLAREH